jgi:hypothetical protein
MQNPATAAMPGGQPPRPGGGVGAPLTSGRSPALQAGIGLVRHAVEVAAVTVSVKLPGAGAPPPA